MKTLIRIIFILLFIALNACKLSNNAPNKAENSLKKRIINPITNSEKSTNLWIDLDTYTKNDFNNDCRGYMNMTIPRLILHVGDSAYFSSLDGLFSYRKDDKFNYRSIKIVVVEDAFLTTENAIIAFVTKIDKHGTKNKYESRIISGKDEIVIAESIDNGVNWKFADLRHLKYEGIENFYSKKDWELIQNYLVQVDIEKTKSEIGKTHTYKSLTLETN